MWKSSGTLVRLTRYLLGSGCWLCFGGRNWTLWIRFTANNNISFLASNSPMQVLLPIPKGINLSFFINLKIGPWNIDLLQSFYLPASSIHLSGLKAKGSSILEGSCVMKERLAMKIEFGGKENSPTLVGAVVLWGKELGATRARRWISIRVAFFCGKNHLSKILNGKNTWV